MLFAVLIRHASYEQPAGVPSAHLLHPLTAEGKAEAHALAGRIDTLAAAHDSRVHEVIDTSPLLRAWQTARIAADVLEASHHRSFELTQHAALCERSLGAAANLSVEQVNAQLSRDPRHGALPDNWKMSTDYCLPVPGAESLRAAGWRVAAHLRARMQLLQASTRAATLKLFVGHGAAFRYGAWALGVLTQADVPRLSMYHCQPVVLAYAADGGFKHVSGDWKVRSESVVDAALD